MERLLGPPGLETKFCRLGEGLSLTEGAVIEGYASVFGATDRGGDVVERGAYAACLKALGGRTGRVKLLWQHDPTEPIGVWDEIREDGRGLWVKGRLLTEIRRGAEALALLQAGAIDGLSIGYRVRRAKRDAKGRRHLHEIELWEVSLVTFPMLDQARVAAAEPQAEDAKAQDDLAAELVAALAEARQALNGSATEPALAADRIDRRG